MRIANTCLTLLLLGTLPMPVSAHGNEPHAECTAYDTTAATTVAAKADWQTATDLEQQIEASAKAGDFVALHDLTQKMTASLNLLKSATAEMPEQRRIRLHGAITQAVRATGDLHQAADKNDAALTTEKQTRLQSALRLIGVLGGKDLL